MIHSEYHNDHQIIVWKKADGYIGVTINKHAPDMEQGRLDIYDPTDLGDSIVTTDYDDAIQQARDLIDQYL